MDKDMFDDLGTFKVAAVQNSPVYLNRQATTNKVCELIRQAADKGAKLVVFPEVFIPGYPYWNWIVNPIEGSVWYEKLYKASVDVPSKETNQICETAAACGIFVVVGINERDMYSAGAIYNTLLTISDQGKIIGHHRKLVPTWAEKLTWTGGDGSGLVVHKTEKIGNLGVLACGENTNTLARFTLLAQGENVHAACYISLPVAPPDYDMAEAIRLRAIAHSFEGKIFTVVSCSTVSEEIIETMKQIAPEAEKMLRRKNSAFSGVIGPDGKAVGDTLIDVDGMTVTEIDLNKTIQPKQMHDIIGHYNRFDIFQLTVNRGRQKSIRFTESTSSRTEESEIGELNSNNDYSKGET